MHESKFSTAFLCGFFGVLSQLSAHAAEITEQTTYHSDGRATPRLDFVTPELVQKNEIVVPTDKALARTAQTDRSKVLLFLTANAERYGLSDTAAELNLIDEQVSLLGTHYRFQQYLGGYEVIAGEIVVTVDKDGNVSRVSNNIFPVNASASANKSTFATLEPEQA